MAGNTFGNIFKITTFGESHGPAIGVVIDGVPPHIILDTRDIQKELDRRRPGQSKITTHREESDQVEILSGVFEGQTTGTAMGLLIRNQDARSRDYDNIKDIFRPGHADYTFSKKYGIRDYTGGGRASGRETACRVAAGAVAKKILEQYGIKTIAYTLAVGDLCVEKIDLDVIEKNIVRAPDMDTAALMVQKIDEARKDCDSLGGVVEAIVKGCPPGLGDPVFDKLNARIAYALMSLGTIRGIEFGVGFAATKMRGSQHNDTYKQADGKLKSEHNYAGGILGGISNGEDIVIRIAVKPPSSIARQQETFDQNGAPQTIQIKGRHDPCICPRVVPVVEAMLALVIVDCLLMQKTIQ